MNSLTRATQDELNDALGNPGLFVNADGRVSYAWETRMAYAHLPASLPLSWDRSLWVMRFLCHNRLVPAFEAALGAIYARRDAWSTINDFGGCYAFRTNRRNPKALSFHAWGAAIDLDVGDNAQGEAPKVDPWVIESFAAEGFLWGGYFLGAAVDGMHYEASHELLASL